MDEYIHELYFRGKQPTTYSPMCLVCKMTSQRMLSNTRHPSRDAISSHEARYNTPVSPAEGMVSKFKVPQTENGNLSSKEKICSCCWGIWRAIYLHFSCPPNLIATTVLTSDGQKERANYFRTHPCSFPWCHYWTNWSAWLFYQILNSRVHGDRKHAHTGASAHRGPLGYLKRHFNYIYLFMCVCEQHTVSRDNGRSWLSIHLMDCESHLSCCTTWQPLLATS